MVSIIIPLYNQADKIKKCLLSIQNQTYQNYEIVVVNDRSTDELIKIIEWSKNEFGIKIEWMHNQENHGAPYSRNKGFRKSKGEFLLFCDADIILEPDALETMLKKLKQIPHIHSTAIIRREHFPMLGWDENITRFQDWDLWLTMLEEGHTGIWIDRVLFQIKGGGHTMSSWLPSFTYKWLPFLPGVKKYKKAMEIVKKKHKLN